MSGATDGGGLSPDGARHPGEIVFDDRVSGHREIRSASAVPVSVAWSDAAGSWVPVVTIVITGAAHIREITSYGPQGERLATTVGSLGGPAG